MRETVKRTLTVKEDKQSFTRVLFFFTKTHLIKETRKTTTSKKSLNGIEKSDYFTSHVAILYKNITLFVLKSKSISKYNIFLLIYFSTTRYAVLFNYYSQSATNRTILARYVLSRIYSFFSVYCIFHFIIHRIITNKLSRLVACSLKFINTVQTTVPINRTFSNTGQQFPA